MGFDGEGCTIDGRHRYRLLCAADEGQRTWKVRNLGGLSAEECLDFLVNVVPMSGLKVGFSLGYDWTKILQDVDREVLVLLTNPGLRLNAEGQPRPVFWRHWKLNMQGARLSVADTRSGRRQTFWDTFRFFQSSFLNALANWSMATPAELELIATMKEQRQAFSEADWSEGGDVERYCLEECRLLARMMHKLRDAARDAGIKLESWHGAGSIASAMLKQHEVAVHVAKHPDKVDLAVRRAYFGGRFECSRIGTIGEPVHGYDINSAYPYALLDLPSLVGRWRRGPGSKRALLQLDPLERHVVVCIEWNVSHDVHGPPAWGPFPVRLQNGTIIFPARGEGCYWLWEVQAAARLFGAAALRVKGSWELVPDDPGVRPHGDIAHYYQERLRWGKDGPGLVLKLGMNARYGKSAQRVGRPRWASLVWAGIVTARCRAMLLDAMAKVRDLRSVLMLATDGLWSLEEIPSLDRGRGLGQWDEKTYGQGVFLARPGVYFPLAAEEREEQWEKVVKARGISRRLLKDHADDMVTAWREGAMGLELRQRRFVGLRSGLRGVHPDDLEPPPDPYAPPDPWPALRRYILQSRHGLRPWPGTRIPGGLGRVRGDPLDVVAAEAPYECPEAMGLWDPADGSDAMLEVLWQLWETHKRQVRRTPKLVMGEWIENQRIKLSFDPRPKRMPGPDRSRPQIESQVYWESHPYDPAVVSPEAAALREELAVYLEQPDGFEVDEVAGYDAVPF